jgi:hypothetical protein
MLWTQLITMLFSVVPAEIKRLIQTSASATLFMKRLLSSVCSYFYVCMRFLQRICDVVMLDN